MISKYIARARQFSTFALVGTLGTLAHYLLLIILVELAGANAVFGSMAGALLGAIINYFLNYRLTFSSTERHRHALPKFLTVASVGFALNAAFMWVALSLIHLHYLLSQIIATVLVLLWNFVGNLYWTFPQGKEGDDLTR